MHPENLAFHYIPKKYLHSVLESGKILPAIYRTDFKTIDIRCGESEILGAIVEGFSDPSPKKDALRYFNRMVKGALRAVRDFQENRGIQTSEDKSEFQCTDFLAGDMECVFLSLGDWVSWAGYKPSGIVFDAEKLVIKGATIRPSDLLREYWRILRLAFKEDWESYGEFELTVLSWFHSAQREGSLSGEEALDYLSGPISQKFRSDEDEEPPEIIWCGALPIKWADQYCVDGEFHGINE